MNTIWAMATMAIGLGSVVELHQQSKLQIVSPVADAIDPPAPGATVTFFVDGRLVCTAERVPFACGWDPGGVVRGHHVRVVATLPDGRRLV